MSSEVIVCRRWKLKGEVESGDANGVLDEGGLIFGDCRPVST